MIERESARSLERLGIDTIDLYWAHGEDRVTDLEETVAAFGALVERGVVRRLGVSNHPTWRVERARAIAARLGVAPCTALQLTTSYVEPRPGAPVPGKDHRFGFVSDETVDYLDDAPRAGAVGLQPAGPGQLRPRRPAVPRRLRPPRHDARGSRRSTDGAERGVPASQLVLAWMLAKGWKPIVGVSTRRAARLRPGVRAARPSS